MMKVPKQSVTVRRVRSIERIPGTVAYARNGRGRCTVARSLSISQLGRVHVDTACPWGSVYQDDYEQEID